MLVWVMIYRYKGRSASTIAIRFPHIGVAVLGTGDDAAGTRGDVDARYSLIVTA